MTDGDPNPVLSDCIRKKPGEPYPGTTTGPTLGHHWATTGPTLGQTGPKLAKWVKKWSKWAKMRNRGSGEDPDPYHGHHVGSAPLPVPPYTGYPTTPGPVPRCTELARPATNAGRALFTRLLLDTMGGPSGHSAQKTDISESPKPTCQNCHFL